MFEKIEALATTYDENIIWDFLKTKDITKDNIAKSMSNTLITDSGCHNEDCKLNYNGADQDFFELDYVGYDFKNNKFIDIEEMLNDDYSIDRKNLYELNEKGIEPLEYFQFYYCTECGMLSYYIE